MPTPPFIFTFSISSGYFNPPRAKTGIVDSLTNSLNFFHPIPDLLLVLNIG